MPAMLLMGQLNFENPDNLLLLRVAFGSLQGLLLLASLFIYFKISSKNTQTKLRVPPAPAAWGMQQEPTEPEEMTVHDYDMAELRKFLMQILMSVGICSVIHYNWGYIPPLFIQSVMAPFTLFDFPLFKIHILGNAETGSLSRPFPPPETNPFASLLGSSQEEQRPAEQQPQQEQPQQRVSSKKNKKKIKEIKEVPTTESKKEQ